MVKVAATPKNEAQLRRCLADKAWRMNHLYTVVDEGGTRVPYRRRWVQLDFARLRHVLDVILKSRQHGITTECCLSILDDAMWIPDLQCGIIAHTKNDAAEIFNTKIELPYLALPPQIRKANPAVELDRSHITFRNGASIRVAVSFRSATTHRLHISEYGKICAKFPARAEEIKTGTLPSVHPQLGGRITIESTAEGSAGHFCELCNIAQAQTIFADKHNMKLNAKQYRFHFYAWQQDPKNAIDPLGVVISDRLKDYFAELEGKHSLSFTPEQMAWYAMTKDGPGGLGKDMMREHPSIAEEAFAASVEGAVYGDELSIARNEGRVGQVPWIKDLPVYTSWDLGVRDATAVWFWQLVRDEIHFIDYYRCVGRGPVYHAQQMLNKPYAYASDRPWAFMPHDVMNRGGEAAIPMIDTYRGLGLKVQKVRRPQSKAQGIAAVRDSFNRFWFDATRCDATDDEADVTKRDMKSSGLRALAYYRYIWDDDAGCYGKEPFHDWASDGASALQTCALAIKYHLIGGDYHGSSPVVANYLQARRKVGNKDWLRRGRFRRRETA